MKFEVMYMVIRNNIIFYRISMLKIVISLCFCEEYIYVKKNLKLFD